MKCVKCNQNLAVVFITKIDETGKQANEGYCLSCAKSLNLAPIDNIINQMGIDPEEMDELNKEMSDMLSNVAGGDEFDEDSEIVSENIMFKDLTDLKNSDSSFGKHLNKIRESLGIKDNEENEKSEKSDNGKEKVNPFAFMNSFLSGTSSDGTDKSAKTQTRQRTKRRKYLEIYGTNLTAKAHEGKIDRIIGRNNEIERTCQILNRRTKNNPCLIGEPGVGKTAIAEGLALKIAEGNVPAKLLGHEIYLLDLSSLVAGTQFRGQFESRIKNIIEETKKAGNIILVIDEVHTIVSAGDAEGAMSAGNILKPALAKGDIQVIGATTLNEYRKYIEKDSALERRFQPVMVDEPNIDETIEIIKGIKEYYEKYHRIIITEDVIQTAVILSERYINDRFLPDKAIDVIDEAASKVNLNNKSLAELEKLKIELKKVQDEKENAASADSIEDYQKAADLKSHECKLTESINNLEKNSREIYLTKEDVAAVIEMWTKIPVKSITEAESDKLINIEKNLHESIIGQDEAVSAVSRAIRRRRAGISAKRRPVSFIFVGPTGVGKTELVKQIARVMFDSEEALIRLDMTEFMEKHSVSKLMGSPPGYVGYDDAGQLTEKVRRRPYSVLLLDEVEKAHPDVFNMLLQILDEGRLADSHGRVVSFENTIIVMTSNAGSDVKSNIAGFTGSAGNSSGAKTERALKDIFRPEFLNRVDEVVMFKELEKPQLLEIISLMLKDLQKAMIEKGITLEVSDTAKEYILEQGYDRTYGARPLRRCIQKHVEDKLSEMYIKSELRAGQRVIVDCDGSGIFVVTKEV